MLISFQVKCPWSMRTKRIMVCGEILEKKYTK